MNHRFGGTFISDNELRKHITKMKKRKKYAWLNDVSNNVVKQAVKDACKAYKAFFKGQAQHPGSRPSAAPRRVSTMTAAS